MNLHKIGNYFFGKKDFCGLNIKKTDLNKPPTSSTNIGFALNLTIPNINGQILLFQ